MAVTASRSRRSPRGSIGLLDDSVVLDGIVVLDGEVAFHDVELDGDIRLKLTT